MSRRLLVLLLLPALTACGVPLDDAPRTVEVLAPSPASPDSPAPVPGSRPTTLYLVREGMLAPVIRRTSAAGSPAAVLQLLLRGPSTSEGGQGLGTALAPEAVLVDEVRTQGATVVVPLRALPEGPGRSDEVLGYAQVVATLTALPGVRAVAFLRDGAPLDVPRADGSLATGPLTRRDYADLL